MLEEFGVHQFGPKADSPRSLAMGSMLYDVFSQITLDARLAPYASGERDLLMEHLDKVGSGDLLLLDRGYPCFWLLFLLKANPSQQSFYFQMCRFDLTDFCFLLQS
ncbi:MAG: hypothetical protein PHI28_01570 [Mangrovibacterium sp.]|nr:hypothetical protein [Mangrovibacterium sp.]